MPGPPAAGVLRRGAASEGFATGFATAPRTGASARGGRLAGGCVVWQDACYQTQFCQRGRCVVSSAARGSFRQHMLVKQAVAAVSSCHVVVTRTAAPLAVGAGHARAGRGPRTRGGGSDFADDSASDMDADEGQGQTQAPVPQQPPFHTLLQAAALGSQGAAESPVSSCCPALPSLLVHD